MSDYKSYQKVLNLSIRPDKIKKPKIKKSQNVTGNTRTKTGCLTCRKRKKKCDEDIVNGKCQGCTRNFLDCSWPVLSALKLQEKLTKQRKLSISSDNDSDSDCSTISNSTVATITSPKMLPISYPSPKSPGKNMFVVTCLDNDQMCSLKD